MPTRFINLPLDVHLNVLGLSGAKEIIALRKTCKTLSPMTRRRIIWIEVVQRIFHSNSTPVWAPSFALEKMSLEELERLAVSPHQFAARMLRSNVTPTKHTTRIHPVDIQRITILSPRSLETVALDAWDSYKAHSRPQQMHLIPGGRFIMVGSSLTLSIWDFSIETQDFRHRPAAQMYLNGGSYSSKIEVKTIGRLCTHLSEDRSRLLICVPTYSQIERSLEFKVYSMEMVNDAPFCTLIANAKFIEQNIIHPFLSDRYICFPKGGNEAIVWDFISDTWARFKTGRGVETVTVHGPNVLIVHLGQVSLWPIPELLPRVNGILPPLVGVPEDLHAFDVADQIYFCDGTNTTHCPRLKVSDDAPAHLDFICSEYITPNCFPWVDVAVAGYSHVRHFTLNPVKVTASGSPLTVPVYRGTTPLTNGLTVWDKTNCFRAIWPREDTVLLFWVQAHELYVCSRRGFNPDESPILQGMYEGECHTLYKNEQRLRLMYDVCPMTGRIATLVESKDGWEAHTLDYIPPHD